MKEIRASTAAFLLTANCTSTRSFLYSGRIINVLASAAMLCVLEGEAQIRIPVYRLFLKTFIFIAVKVLTVSIIRSL